MAKIQKIQLCFSVLKFWLRYCPKEFGWTCVRYICTNFFRVYSSAAHSPLHCRAALTGRRGLTQITGFYVFVTLWFGELGARLIRRRNVVTGYARWYLVTRYCCSLGNMYYAEMDICVVWRGCLPRNGDKKKTTKFKLKMYDGIPIRQKAVRQTEENYIFEDANINRFIG